jgi:hypothetical protein
MTFVLLVPLVLVSLALVWGVALGYPEAEIAGSELSGKEQAIVKAAADTFFPHGGTIPESGTEAGAVGYFGGLLAGAPFKTRFLIRMLLRFVEHGPWIFGVRARFTSQSPEARVQTLREWSTSPIYFLRVSFQSLRALIGLAYLANEAVAARVGAAPNLNPFERRSA